MKCYICPGPDGVHCKVCHKPQRENTEGDLKFCQGHTPAELELWEAGQEKILDDLLADALETV